MWEVISAIAGTISAICDVRGTGNDADSHSKKSATDGHRQERPSSTRSLLLCTVAWCLAVLSFMWIEQPYGTYLSDREYKQLLGWIIAGPALLIFIAASESPRKKAATSTSTPTD